MPFICGWCGYFSSVLNSATEVVEVVLNLIDCLLSEVTVTGAKFVPSL